MVEILRREYWSKADAFLVPLTGLKKDDKFGMKSHLFWNEYSIYDYQLTLSFNLEEREQLINWCRKFVFPVLDKKGYLVENYDILDKTIFILDIAEWADDIRLFLKGKYSKFSDKAKAEVIRYHKQNKQEMPIHIYAVLYPDVVLDPEVDILDGLTPIEYVSKHYGFELEELKRIGEIGTIYDNMPESLITDSDFCHSVQN